MPVRDIPVGKSEIDRLTEKDLTQKGVEAICRIADRPRKDVTDRKQNGLQLRIGRNTVAWWFRSGVGGIIRRVYLGDVPDLSIGDARALAAAAVSLIKRDAGEPDDAWVTAKRIEMGIDIAIAVAPTRAASRWTYAKAVDEFLAGIEKTTRPKTRTAYRHCLTHPSMRELNDVDVSSITRRQVATIIAGVHANGTEAMAKSIADTVRRMWSYLEQDHVIEKSRVEVGCMDRLVEPQRSRTTKDNAKPREKTPTVGEAAFLLAVARNGKMSQPMGLALELMVLTAQRRFSIVLARKEKWNDDEDYRIWELPPEDLKTGEVRKGSKGEKVLEHELPLPPSAAKVMDEAIRLADGNDWVFPQVRAKRDGMPVSHLNESSLTHALGELPGVHFTPHDLRRAFTTFIEGAKTDKGVPRFPDGYAAKILDHAEGRDTKDTTNRHYNRYRYFSQKYAMLELWQDALERYVVQFEALQNWDTYAEQAKANRNHRRLKVRKGQAKTPKPFP